MSLYKLGLSLNDISDPGQFVKDKAREGALEAIPKIKEEVRKEAKATVTPIVKKGLAIGGILGIIIGFAIGRK